MRSRNRLRWVGALLAAALVFPGVASAKPTEPTADLPGSRDSAVLKRFQGSKIVSYEHKSQGEFALPLAPLEKVPERKDTHNNFFFAPKQKKELVGDYTRLVYLTPPDHSPLELANSYADEVKRQGGRILFQCAGEECGGDPKRGSGGGGGRMSLSMHLYPEDTFTDKHLSLGDCLMRTQLSDRRYFSAQLAKPGTYVSVYTFTVAPDACESTMPNRTVALVQIIEGGREVESRSVTVNAAALAESISTVGRATVYGIYFDTNQAEIKGESEPTLEQMAKLLTDRPKLKVLIVGHTDNVGGYTANVELSQRRAKAVVSALSTRFKIAADRLTAVGVSSASPLDTNKTDAGRAKNRRVEIVEQ
jgi:OmpA-OmpF porin, OOP family